jgi:pyruvate/2-oxoglutarate dehydrogenase complex dihydrolipoamide acyltransferase (E2) component
MADAQPLTRMRKAIAKSMSASATIPQFAVERELEVETLATVRATIPEQLRPSYADAITASVAQALADHPWINASFTDDGIVQHEEINIALAVAIDGGLISPVIIGADKLSIAELAAERIRISKAAKEETLKPQEVLSGTFTISNLGPLGVRRFNGLVVPPQAGILAVGAIDQGKMALTLSVDHRLVDGAPAALFLGQVCSQLEDRAWIDQLFAVLGEQ